jgi:hypothetical protein
MGNAGKRGTIIITNYFCPNNDDNHNYGKIEMMMI